MENKRKWNRIDYICMIFILSSGLIFYPADHTKVYAEEVEDGDGGETEESPSSNDSEKKDEKENSEKNSEDKSEDKSKEKEDDKKEESKKESEDKDNDKEKDE